MTPVFQPVTTQEFSAQAQVDGDRLTVEVKGTADLRAREHLETLIGQVHTEAVKRSVGEVVVDLRLLEFMNSSCFKSLVHWIGKVQELETGKRYRIRFLSSTAMLWQRRSLHALKAFATDLITVEGS